MGNVLTVVEAVFVAVSVATFVARLWSKREDVGSTSQDNTAAGHALMTNNQLRYGDNPVIYNYFNTTISRPNVAEETTSQLPSGSGSTAQANVDKVGPWGNTESGIPFDHNINDDVKSILTRIPTQEVIMTGTWGHPDEGLSFNHNSYDGIKTIKIWCGWVIDSIEVQYTRNGELEWASKTRSHGGNLKMIDLDDGEYINEVTGYYGRLFGFGTINSLTFFTNRNKKFGPYGLKNGTPLEQTEAEPTPFQVRGGKIVGFHGTFGVYMSSIGFYVSPPV